MTTPYELSITAANTGFSPGFNLTGVDAFFTAISEYQPVRISYYT